MGGPWAAWAEEEAGRIRAEGRWRSVRDVAGPEPATSVAGAGGDRDVVSFASNDYLGLTRHPAVLAAAQEALARWGSGAGSARLVAGARHVHRALEADLAEWKGAEAAVLFPTGFAANLGVLQALAGPGVTVVSDELNHASIVDGCRLSRAAVTVSPHADVAAVEAAVAAAPGRALVVTESVFSMDGDGAPVEELLDACGRHDALLVLDEAHAVLGPAVDPRRGAGPVLRVGTLSKALASLGGFVAGPAGLCELLVNRARSFIFTTASTPADTAAARAALAVLR
ncbi:MAG: aminotransferase class I/II-fold pyridoxal phosphate-dependent enzyme, partial [Acidimicrobiales bacterium]